MIGPLLRQERGSAAPSQRPAVPSRPGAAARETSLLKARHQVRIDELLEHSQALKLIYEKRLALQQIWARTSANGHDMLAATRQWIGEAEASGIQSLREFAEQLKTYSLRRPELLEKGFTKAHRSGGLLYAGIEPGWFQLSLTPSGPRVGACVYG